MAERTSATSPYCLWVGTAVQRVVDKPDGRLLVQRADLEQKSVEDRAVELVMPLLGGSGKVERTVGRASLDDADRRAPAQREIAVAKGEARVAVRQALCDHALEQDAELSRQAVREGFDVIDDGRTGRRAFVERSGVLQFVEKGIGQQRRLGWPTAIERDFGDAGAPCDLL